MKKSDFTELQIIKVLPHRKPTVRYPTSAGNRNQSGDILLLESKYSGMDVSQLKQLKKMEKELAQYKTIATEPALQINALRT